MCALEYALFQIWPFDHDLTLIITRKPHASLSIFYMVIGQYMGMYIVVCVFSGFKCLTFTILGHS